MKNLSLDHVHYRYSDEDTTRDFYVNIMEAIELPSLELGGKKNLQFALGGVTLLFALSADPIPTPVPATERLGAYHIAFLVEDCEAATQYYSDRCAVIAVPPKKYSDTIRASFLEAPDGMWLELKQNLPK